MVINLKYFSKIRKIDLSNDAKDIMEISLLTNSYPPKKNISEKISNLKMIG